MFKLPAKRVPRPIQETVHRFFGNSQALGDVAYRQGLDVLGLEYGLLFSCQTAQCHIAGEEHVELLRVQHQPRGRLARRLSSRRIQLRAMPETHFSGLPFAAS